MQENELVTRAKFGDKQALGQIIEMYYSDVYKFLVRRHGNIDIAQDVTQNTFLKFSQSLSGYADKGKLRGFIFTIAVSCSNDFFRASRSHDLSLEEYEDTANEASPESSYELSDERERIKSIVLSLPQGQRDVVILRYYHDMTHKAISKVLDIPVATVKTRLFRANNTLRKMLKGEYNEQ